MECQRCGSPVTTFSLDETASFVCEECGYVGVSADHGADGTSRETWAEALARFRDRHDPIDGVGTVGVTVAGRTYRVRPEIRERYRSLTEKQQAIIRELLAEDTPAEPARTRAEIGAAAGVHRSYVSEVAKDHGDIAVALAAGDRP